MRMPCGATVAVTIGWTFLEEIIFILLTIDKQRDFLKIYVMEVYKNLSCHCRIKIGKYNWNNLSHLEKSAEPKGAKISVWWMFLFKFDAQGKWDTIFWFSPPKLKRKYQKIPWTWHLLLLLSSLPWSQLLFLPIAVFYLSLLQRQMTCVCLICNHVPDTCCCC